METRGNLLVYMSPRQFLSFYYFEKIKCFTDTVITGIVGTLAGCSDWDTVSSIAWTNSLNSLLIMPYVG